MRFIWFILALWCGTSILIIDAKIGEYEKLKLTPFLLFSNFRFKNLAIVDICTLPFARGICGATFERWFYDSHTKQCKSFIFSGCRGNANQFKTKEKCEERCASSKPS